MLKMFIRVSKLNHNASFKDNDSSMVMLNAWGLYIARTRFSRSLYANFYFLSFTLDRKHHWEWCLSLYFFIALITFVMIIVFINQKKFIFTCLLTYLLTYLHIYLLTYLIINSLYKELFLNAEPKFLQN